MQVSVDLQEPFSYSVIGIIITLALIVVLTIYFYKKKPVKKEVVPEIKVVKGRDVKKIKIKYIKKLGILYGQIQKNEVSIRKAYQRLSKIIRYFVFEVTEIKVQNYTLDEIQKLNMPQLYELILEYYKPEFARNSVGAIKESVLKTREVIKEWN